jgi:hypothetical protein
MNVTMKLLVVMCISMFTVTATGSVRSGSRHPTPPDSPCAAEECRQFDFWVGDWTVSWTGKEGKRLRGTNRIQSVLDGCVIEENFDDPVGMFRGRSFSVYNKTTKQWQQTWVDNTGGYLDFVGEFKDGKMILGRKATKDGKEFLQRMVWYDIATDALEWNWERSDDQGKTWTLLWSIHYTRGQQ